MSRWLIALLALMLAACSDSEPPVPEPDATPVEMPVQTPVEPQAGTHDDQPSPSQPEQESISQPIARDRPEPQLELIPPLPPSVEPVVERQVVAMAGIPAIAIVIDDVGHNLSHGRRLLALPDPVALAILPHTQAAQQLADEAVQAGRTVMLHQPMENGAGLSIGPGGLYSGMSGTALRQTLQTNLDSFAHIRGINNHMGSRLTREREVMDEVMQLLEERDLFFIDSRTTHHTQAAFAAEAAGVQHLSRDVFLDNERTAEAIGNAFNRALELARKQGSALIIGHPYPQTIAFLEQRLAGDIFEREGVRVVSVEELLMRKYGR